MTTTKTKATPSKPAKPARGDRKPPGTRKAPTKPGTPSGAAMAPDSPLTWKRIVYNPVKMKDLRPGMLATITTVGDIYRTWEGVIEMIGRTPGGWRIEITLRNGERDTIVASDKELADPWHGTPWLS